MKPATIEEREATGKALFKALMDCAAQCRDDELAVFTELGTSMIALSWQISRMGLAPDKAMEMLAKAEAAHAG